MALFVCAVASAANAQQLQWTDKAFVSVNVGVQAASHDLNTTQTFTLYDENATVTTSQKNGSGALFDIGGGYRVWENMAVGLTYSFAPSKATPSVHGSIPDPFVFDQPRPVDASAGEAKHRESALHFDATWMMPMTDKIDVGISAGPSIYIVSQDLVTSLIVNEPGPTVQSTSLTNESKMTVGLNVGVDVRYLLTEKWGVGGVARYTWASVKLGNPSSSLTVGGLQIGGGFRMRF